MKAQAICSFRPSLRWNLPIKHQLRTLPARRKTFVGFLSAPLFALGVIITLAGNAPANAFSLFPEFRGASEDSADAVESPDKINSEYSSDYLTFLKPFSWEKNFWANPNAFDLSTGSLSGEEFQIQDRLKLHQWILEGKLQFRFTYFAERDYEIDQDHKILELVYKPHPFWGLSLSGETSLYKAEDDLGVGLLFTPNEKSEHRLFYSWTDFSRNDRNTEPDRFLKEPVRYGTVGRHFEGPFFVSYAFTNAPQLKWDFPTDQREYVASDWLTEFEMQYDFESGQSFAIDVTFDESSELEAPTAGAPLIPKTVRRKRALARTETSLWWQAYRLRAGVAYFYRDYEINQDRVLFRDTLPYFGFGLKPKNFEQLVWQNELSVEATHFNPADSAKIVANAEKETGEYRLNWRTGFDFKKQGELALLLTFDLDEFGTGRTWEGGNAQFRFWF